MVMMDITYHNILALIIGQSLGLLVGYFLVRNRFCGYKISGRFQIQQLYTSPIEKYLKSDWIRLGYQAGEFANCKWDMFNISTGFSKFKKEHNLTKESIEFIKNGFSQCPN